MIKCKQLRNLNRTIRAVVATLLQKKQIWVRQLC